LRDGVHGQCGDFGSMLVKRMAGNVEAEQFLFVAEALAQGPIGNGHLAGRLALRAGDHLGAEEAAPSPSFSPPGDGERHGVVDLCEKSCAFGPKSSQAPDFTSSRAASC